MFTNFAHTATRNAVSAERWCAYSLPAANALFGAARLASEGVGPYAPLSNNTAETGRAENRRVEMVLR